MDIRIFLLSILIFAMPYNLVGTNTGSLVIMISGLFFIILNYAESNSSNYNTSIHIKYLNKYYYFMIIFLCSLGFVSFFTIKSLDIWGSFHGFTLYLDLIIYYKIFFSFGEEDKYKFYYYSAFILAALSVIFVIYQGIILKVRVDGTVGYANSYSLLLLIGLYFNCISNNQHIKNTAIFNLINIFLIIAILYTGSRNSFFYLIVFMTFQLMKKNNGLKNLYIFFSFVTSLICFIILQLGGLNMLIIMPPIIYISHIITKNFASVKIHPIAALSTLFVTSCTALIIGKHFLKSSLLERLTKISIYTGVLQERFVYFEDAFKHILANLIGSGINSFPYTQYLDQSAFYDVRFIHNSILQIAYDIGIFASVIFLIIVVLGAVIILKNKSINRTNILIIYITIFMHSLLDFDLSFASIFILLCGLTAFSKIEHENTQSEIKSKTKKLMLTRFTSVICGLLLAAGIYTLIPDMLILTGSLLISSKNYDSALSIYKLADKLQLKSNPYTCVNIAEIYNQEYSDINSLKKSMVFLKKAEKINPSDPLITGNIAFEYERLNEISKSNEYYIRFLKKEQFYYKAYSSYYNFLNRYYLKNSINYKHGMGVMKKAYSNALNNLNPRSNYLNNQLYILQNYKFIQNP